MTTAKAKPHPFTQRPHYTLLTMMFPVLLSLIAEPLTGLVDTAFIARLGADELAGLGVAAVALSAVFWVFNFLQTGTQTQVSQAAGAGKEDAVAEIVGLALVVGWALGAVVALTAYPLAPLIAGLLGAEGAVADAAVTYIRVRAISAPAIFTTLVCFGTLFGAQDTRWPSVIAVAVNAFNIALDYPLIFGAGPLVGLGVAGAALASASAQVIGGAWALFIVLRRYGFTPHLSVERLRALFSIGGNLFARTGLLTLFLLVGTRVANQISPEAGAAHQVVRQVYIFTALALDAFAISTQSLVGYFLGGGDVPHARRAATLSLGWSLATGVLLAVVMLLLTDAAAALLVPPAAVAVFLPAWVISALVQPIGAVVFATDGIHLGTGDYAYLRNAMFAATALAGTALLLIPTGAAGAFTWVWVVTALWNVVRGGFGFARVYWHPSGRAPLALEGA